MDSTPAAESTTRPPERVAALLAVLGALTALPPFTIDMYVPGLPELTRSLHTTSSAAQLSITAFLIGLAVGQILLGPISDGLGRRRILLAGTSCYVLFSLVCAVAPNIQVLIAGRLLEGVTGAAGVVIARAVLTDRFHGPVLSRRISALSLIMGIAPVVAPVIGGGILSFASWRLVFAALATMGVVLVLSVIAWVPESLPEHRRHKGRLAGTFTTMGRLCSRRVFLGYVLTLTFAAGGMFAYIAGSTFVFQDVYGVSPTQYSLIFAVNSLAMLLCSALFGRLAGRFNPGLLVGIAVAVALAASVALITIQTTVGGSMIATWICLILITAGIGVIFPGTMAIGQSLAREAPGAASALLGGGQFTGGAIASPLVGAIGATGAMPMSLVIVVCFGCCFLALITLARPWRDTGEHLQPSAPSDVRPVPQHAH